MNTLAPVDILSDRKKLDDHRVRIRRIGRPPTNISPAHISARLDNICFVDRSVGKAVVHSKESVMQFTKKDHTHEWSLRPGTGIVVLLDSSPHPECLMTPINVRVATSSIQIVCGSHCVMSIPLRIWQPSRTAKGTIVWSSRSRTAVERRTLIATLHRVIRETSDVALNRRLIRALAEQSPVCCAITPIKRAESFTAGLPMLARLAKGASFRNRRLYVVPRQRLRNGPKVSALEIE